MGLNTVGVDPGIPPKDDFEVAETVEQVLDVYTETGNFDDVPSDVKKELDGWMDPYLQRRDGEVGVSPRSPRILDAFLDVWNLEWTHIISETEAEAKRNPFEPGSTKFITISASSLDTLDHALQGMKRSGWELYELRDSTGEYSIKAKFVPVRHDFEVLRRLLVAGLSRAEAMSFWATELVDLKKWDTDINQFLRDGFDLNKVEVLSDALGTSTEAVYMSRKNARQKLEEIDPSLPEFLIRGNGGRPLPDEMWSEQELDRLRRIQSTP